MQAFASKHPVIFGLALFIVSIVACIPFMFALQAIGFPAEAAGAFSRLAVGVIIAIVFRSRIPWGNSFKGFVIALPAFLFAVWNIVYNLAGGCEITTTSGGIIGAIVLGLAPAVFEELIFRGAAIDALRSSGANDMLTLIVSALLFAAVHLTNAVGMELVSVLVQVLYSVSVGLILGSVYILSGDILTVILAHASIDIASQLFLTHPETTSVPFLIAFIVLIVAEGAYAVWMVGKNGNNDTSQSMPVE